MHRAGLTLLSVILLLAGLFSATSKGNPPGSSSAPGASSAPDPARPVDYLRDIRPLLSDNCYACHGPDEEAREANLRLDERPGAVAETDSGVHAIVPGKPDESEALRRLVSEDSAELMPPPDSGKKLTADEIALIRRWIEQGAPWSKHWSLLAPERPEAPRVSAEGWPRNAIDRFVLARLEERGLHPSPEADKETLIRRVTLHLTGLPPTLEDVDAFLADDSPEAYERVVDRLLASPHYGEHMARFWLDAARYGDTHGLHLDNYREMWLYRDWVVKAFNTNLPYDQFTIDQLAGDLLPEPTAEQLIATGFCRSHVTTNEGGSIEEEVYVRNVVDRVSNVGTVFLGLTLGCAVCHDHKFDPVTQKEFYQLFAFFNSLDGPSLDGNVQDPAPVLRVPGEELTGKLERLRIAIEELEGQRAEIEKETSGAKPPEAKARQQLNSDLAAAQRRLVDGLDTHATFDDPSSEAFTSTAGESRATFVGGPKLVDGFIGKAIEISADSFVELGNVGDFDDDQAFSFGAWIKAPAGAEGVVLAKTDSSNLYRGYELSVEDGRVRTQIGRRDPGYLINVVTKSQAVPPGEWSYVMVTYDGSKQAGGTVVYVDGRRQDVEIFSDSLKYKDGIRNAKPLVLGRRHAESAFDGGQIDEVLIYKRRLSDADVEMIHLCGRLAAKRASEADPEAEIEPKLARRLRLHLTDNRYQCCADAIDLLSDRLQREAASSPTTMIFKEQRKPRDAFVLNRGQYDQQGEKVERLTPQMLPPMPADLGRDRLGLAQWLVSAEQPLTSRVAVNRFWQQFFGVGLVETSEDFGSQGSPPSNPELLDWLAVEFRESGWNVKALVKQIVMSAAYRQSSRFSESLAGEDPYNRLLARGPRFRLDAETLRDQALAVSGILVDRMGGPSVKPPQPEGLWEAVGFIGSNTAKFVPDTDFDKTHRRSLYTFWKRTAPAPEMTTFDAPSREATCVRRERTNTPMQALLLMNDPQYVEAARGLAERTLRDRQTTAKRAAYMYRLCTGRDASQATVAELSRLLEEQLAAYRSDEAAAREFVESAGPAPSDSADAPELAAWTVVANLVLNLDEVISTN